MLHEVRVFSPKGNLKHVVSSEKLSKRHWRVFEKTENNMHLNRSRQGTIPKWVKEKLDFNFGSPDLRRNH